MTANLTSNGIEATGGSPGWLRFLVRAAALTAVALLVTEGMWHGLGYPPQQSDLIYFAGLRKAADTESNAVTLVGSSRFRYGLNPATLGAAIPGRRFLQLALDGNSALPVLSDLAKDPNFHGLVVCELNPPHWDGQYNFGWRPEAVKFAHPEVSGAYLEMVLDEHVRQHFSFFSYDLFTELPNLLQHKPRKPIEHPDRFEPMVDLGPTIDRKLTAGWEDVAREAAKRIGTKASWQMPAVPLSWINQIRARGGDVAFVRMPIYGSLRVIEDQLFPHLPSLMQDMRAKGFVVIDFADMPEHFYCPDGSHLEEKEADRFSRLAAQALAAKGFFR